MGEGFEKVLANELEIAFGELFREIVEQKCTNIGELDISALANAVQAILPRKQATYTASLINRAIIIFLTVKEVLNGIDLTVVEYRRIGAEVCWAAANADIVAVQSPAGHGTKHRFKGDSIRIEIRDLLNQSRGS